MVTWVTELRTRTHENHCKPSYSNNSCSKTHILRKTKIDPYISADNIPHEYETIIRKPLCVVEQTDCNTLSGCVKGNDFSQRVTSEDTFYLGKPSLDEFNQMYTNYIHTHIAYCDSHCIEGSW